MKITIDVPSREIARLAENALKKLAWDFEMKRVFCEEQYDAVRQKNGISSVRKERALNYYSRREKENQALSNQLWEIGETIREQTKAGTWDAEK